MRESMRKAIEICRGLRCAECPIRDYACVIAEVELEEELEEGDKKP